jgi:alpha-galactosidase
VLDLTRPEVREFVFHTVDDLLTQNPGVSYIKWDCNRYITQPGSTYLKPEDQQNLFIDYVNALYDVMARVSKNHPNVQMMACAGGGGRVDYGVLRYFDGFWPSDNTDPLARVKIQWGYSQFFPAAATCDHVTRKGNRPIKFAFDVAMSGCLGLDVDVSKYSDDERRFAAAATATYNTFRDVVLGGDLYRLESPYDGDRASLMYVTPDRSRAVMFVYQTKSSGGGSIAAVLPKGLDLKRRYHVRELNLPAGDASKLAANDHTIDGVALMKSGLVPSCSMAFDSAVIELKAEQPSPTH